MGLWARTVGRFLEAWAKALSRSYALPPPCGRGKSMVNNHAIKGNSTQIQRRPKTYSALEFVRFLQYQRELFFFLFSIIYYLFYLFMTFSFSFRFLKFKIPKHFQNIWPNHFSISHVFFSFLRVHHSSLHPHFHNNITRQFMRPHLMEAVDLSSSVLT